MLPLRKMALPVLFSEYRAYSQACRWDGAKGRRALLGFSFLFRARALNPVVALDEGIVDDELLFNSEKYDMGVQLLIHRSLQRLARPSLFVRRAQHIGRRGLLAAWE